MDVVTSILQRLRNKAQKTGISFQLALQLFCQEEFLRRLSYSEYHNNLILKGGLFLYLISNFEARPTMDIDFLVKNYPNENEKMIEMIREIITINTENQFIEFEIRSITSITEHKEYPGVRIKVLGVIGNTRTPFDIDIGVGDIVIPKPNKRKLEVLLPDFNSPEVLTYSLESTIAEKWDAIVDRMEFNSRMKDFYDIYYLAMNHDFMGNKLQEAIYGTLGNRGRAFGEYTLDNVKLLKKDEQLLLRWKVFTENIVEVDLNFNDVIDVIIDFVGEPFECMLNKRVSLTRWNKSIKKWE